MAVSMYSGFVPVCLQLLAGLKTVLQKTEEHTTAQKWDPSVVLNLRLYPDMFTLERQVRQVCNHALGAGRVAASRRRYRDASRRTLQSSRSGTGAARVPSAGRTPGRRRVTAPRPARPAARAESPHPLPPGQLNLPRSAGGRAEDEVFASCADRHRPLTLPS